MAAANQIKKYEAKGNFTTVCNIPIIELSATTLGVFIKVLRMHNSEDVDEITKGLIVAMTGLKPAQVTKALEEMRMKGYCLMYRVKDRKNGQFKTKYKFTEYPSDKYQASYVKQKQRKSDETKKMVNTQKANNNYKFFKYRHLKPIDYTRKTMTNNKTIVTQTRTTKGLLADYNKAAKPSQRKFIDWTQDDKTINSYKFIVKAMMVYEFHLHRIHGKRMTWTTNHGKRLIDLIEEIQIRVQAALGHIEEEQVLIQLSFFLSCVNDEHKTKGEPNKFFPGLLHHEFMNNWDNYGKKRRSYLERGLLIAPDFLVNKFNTDNRFKLQTEQLINKKHE